MSATISVRTAAILVAATAVVVNKATLKVVELGLVATLTEDEVAVVKNAMDRVKQNRK